MIKNWNTRRFRTDLLDSLERKGNQVGEFVSHDARRRLLSIREPRWGAGYRRGTVANLIGHSVERGSNQVIVYVGVRPSPKGRHHGFYIEVGSHTHGPQPFLRPAVFGNGKQVVKILERG